jgi:hypothetical protein
VDWRETAIAYEQWAEKNLPVDDDVEALVARIASVARDHQPRPFEYLPDFDKIELEFEDFVHDLLFGMGEVILRKHQDYGPLNISRSPGGPLNGLRVRLHDKLARINHLIDNGAEPRNESLRDSFLDLANYGVIALMVIDGTWPGE